MVFIGDSVMLWKDDSLIIAFQILNLYDVPKIPTKLGVIAFGRPFRTRCGLQLHGMILQAGASEKKLEGNIHTWLFITFICKLECLETNL